MSNLPASWSLAAAASIFFVTGFSVTGILPVMVMAQVDEPANDLANKPVRAMRAPLDIIPAPMRTSPESSLKKPSPDMGKLTPRAGGRQMKRAVRSVAPMPGVGGQIVQIGQLGALEDAPVGLEPGFGPSIWNGTRFAFVTDLMARLPLEHSLPALRAMEVKLYRGASAAPVGTVQGSHWVAARLNRFLMLGELQSVIDLLALTGADQRDAYAARAHFLALLGLSDMVAACRQPMPKRDAVGRADTQVFFLKSLIYCHLVRGDLAKAALALELNEKILKNDTLFTDLAFLLATEAPVRLQMADAGSASDPIASDIAAPSKHAPVFAPVRVPTELTDLQIALLRLTGQPLQSRSVLLPPYLLQSLADDYQQPPLLQLSAAQRTLVQGSQAVEKFSEISQLINITRFEQAGEQSTHQSALVFLVVALRMIDAASQADQLRLTASYLHHASARGLWPDLVLALGDRLTDLELPQSPTPEAGPLAPRDAEALLPALIWVGATQKIALLSGQVEMSEQAQRLVALVKSQRMRAVPETSKAPEALEASEQGVWEVSFDWDDFVKKLDRAEAQEQYYMLQEAAVYVGLGYAVPEAVRARTGLEGKNAMGARLLKLSGNRWIGDLVLAIITTFADRPASKWEPVEINYVLSALHSAGLTAEAEAIGSQLLAYQYAHRAYGVKKDTKKKKNTQALTPPIRLTDKSTGWSVNQSGDQRAGQQARQFAEQSAERRVDLVNDLING